MPSLLIGTGCFLFLVVVVLLLWFNPPNPMAILQVTNAAGEPVAGAVIKPDGLRPKGGGGHYSWGEERFEIEPAPVITDSSGEAELVYPFYVTEHLETGEISFQVDHPDYVPDRPFRIVSASPPRNASLLKRAEFLLQRLLRKVKVKPDPVTLQRGGILLVSGHLGGPEQTLVPVKIQVSGFWTRDTNSWVEIDAGRWMCRRIPPGSRQVRLIHESTDGVCYFSALTTVTARAGATNELHLPLSRGTRLSGRLEDQVPRPIRQGRVVLEVWPQGARGAIAGDSARWHSWTAVDTNGAFEVASLPRGRLEIVAICEGFISRNGSATGGSTHRLPQEKLLETEWDNIVVRMEPTARLEVTVMDDQGRALPNARVSLWPNVRWGEYSSSIFASDLYHSIDWLPPHSASDYRIGPREVPDFQGSSDTRGIAVVPNLPLTASGFALTHADYEMPVHTTGRERHRYGQVKLVAGETNRITVTLQKKGTEFVEHPR